MLAKTDAETGKPLVDVIVDQAEQKGTGRWTSQDALELGVPLTGITEAVFARSLSALRDQRARASRRARRARRRARPAASRSSTTSARRCTPRKVVAYAQGFEQMAAAAQHLRLGPRTWASWPRSGAAAASSARAS